MYILYSYCTVLYRSPASAVQAVQAVQGASARGASVGYHIISWQRSGDGTAVGDGRGGLLLVDGMIWYDTVDIIVFYSSRL